jgi:murein tripeptide amidase MpaA
MEEVILRISTPFRFHTIILIFLLFPTLESIFPNICGGGEVPSLKTRAELTEFRETTPYDETISFIRQLQRESPYIRLEQFGETSSGRPLYVAVLSRNKLFTPALAAASGKPVILISNGIHAGEICGKEASLMLLRDMIRGDLGDLLEQIVLLVVPVFNADGHERVSPHNRLNQKGPESGMGFRANALGYDLNRDFMKLETPEVKA